MCLNLHLSLRLECERLRDFLRDLSRLLVRDLVLVRRRSLDLFLRSRERERFLERDLLRFLERDRLLLPLDRDLDLRLLPLDLDLDLLLDLDLDRPLFLSLDKIPITGSIAADIKFCASFTRVMASSISLCAASLLFACGLSMFTVEWQICT